MLKRLARIAEGSAVFGVIAVFAACTGGGGADGGADGGVDVIQPAHFRPSLCTAENEAPIGTADGGRACVRVGADPTPAPAEWPDVSGGPTPVVYVRSGVSGGTGTMAQPFADLASALAASPGTIALARGEYVLSGPVNLDRTVDIRGAGSAAMGTELVAARAMPGVTISGDAVSATVSGLALRYATTSTTDDRMAAGFLVQSGATLTLRDVTIDGAFNGVVALGARLRATRVTVRHATNRGISLGAASDGLLASVLVRDGQGNGVVAEDSHLGFETGLVIENARDGLSIQRGIAGQVNNISLVSMLCNGITGIRAEGIGAAVQLSRVTASGTRRPAGTVGGDGVFVGAGASVTVDPGMIGDGTRGQGSEVVGNARTGFLASGTGTGLRVHSSLVGSNLGPGIYVQARAVAQEVAYVQVEDNVALGVGVTSGGALMLMLCNGIAGTRMGPIMTEAATLQLGDGVALSEGVSGATMTANVISDNARFGVIFSQATAAFTRNSGSNNQFGIGRYGTTVEIDSSNSVIGNLPSPEAPPPTARGQVDIAP